MKFNWVFVDIGMDFADLGGIVVLADVTSAQCGRSPWVP